MKIQVMVVDDDPTIREMMRGALEMWDVSAFVASSACEAITRVREHEEIQLLITDINMPGMDGLALARMVRKERPGLPIIAVTGEDLDSTEVFEDVLIKPVMLGKLEGVVNRYIARRPTAVL